MTLTRGQGGDIFNIPNASWRIGMRTLLAQEVRVHTATGEALVEWKSVHMQLSFVCIGWSGFGGGVRRTCFLAWSHHVWYVDGPILGEC